MMKRLVSVTALCVSLLLQAGNLAFADGCSAGARKLIAGKPNHQILSVTSGKDANGKPICIAKIKMATGDGKPERVVERKFKP